MTISTLRKQRPSQARYDASEREPLKIAIARRYYSLRRGGAERYCVNLSRQLRKLGHQVTFVGEQIDRELRDEIPFLPVRVKSTTSAARNGSFARNCQRAVAGKQFDIVYGLGRSLGVDVFRVTERIQAHWLNVRYGNRFTCFLQHLNPRHRTLIELERTICQSPQTRKIVTISSVDGKLLQHYFGISPEKIRTIYNGVDTELFHPQVQRFSDYIRWEWGIDLHAPVLVFASMDFAGKGLSTVLQAMQASRHGNLHLIVLGKGPERRFARIADSLGLANRVTFAGRQDRVEQFYGAADLLVLPTSYEPFPNVVLEGLACGLPAITTATAGGADVIEEGKTGYVLSHSAAVGELTGGLDRHFSKSAAEREVMAEACRVKSAGMTIENNARQVAELFYEVRRDKLGV